MRSGTHERQDAPPSPTHLKESVPGLGDGAAEGAIRRHLGEGVEQRAAGHAHAIKPQLALRGMKGVGGRGEGVPDRTQ